MKNFTKHTLWAVAIVLLINSCTRKSEPFRVFMVFSYHPEYNWVIEEIDGVNEVFRDNEVITESFFMDTKRKTSEAWKTMMADSAMKMINQFDPDLLMVFDDNACEYVAKQFVGTDMPVVFCGMNADPSHYGFPTKNITGITEEVPLNGMVEFLQELVPDIQKVAFMSDQSLTSAGIDEHVRQMEVPVEILEIRATNNFDEWKSTIEAWQDQIDAIGILTYHTITDTLTGESMNPSDVMKWTTENNKLPDFSLFDFAVYDGVLCSYYIPGNEQGSMAASLALEILRGKSPEEISITYPTEGIRLVNNDRAQQLGIEIPEGIDATIINE
ncbi:MAG: hypothetical protein ISS17_02625 [Bacteroidales bacterium]|nr:hypothetical protein [Bacteroidales bacterium]